MIRPAVLPRTPDTALFHKTFFKKYEIRSPNIAKLNDRLI